MDQSWIKEKLKAHPCKLTKSGNVMTCPVRLSFPALFTAKEDQSKRMKFSAALLFPKGADLSLLLKEAQRVAKENMGDKWKAKLPSGKIIGNGKALIELPFRDQEEKEDKEGYEPGAYFINAKSDTRPGVVDARARPITDESAIYPGVWALVSLRPFWYDVDVNKGVSFGLQNVQKLADDEPLGGGRARAEDEFEPLDDADGGDDDWSTHGDDLGNLAGL